MYSKKQLGNYSPLCGSISKTSLAKFCMSRYQEQYKLEAMRGMGIDRHLFGLYVIAKGMKMDPLPRLFRDKVLLSTDENGTHSTPSL